MTDTDLAAGERPADADGAVDRRARWPRSAARPGPRTDPDTAPPDTALRDTAPGRAEGSGPPAPAALLSVRGLRVSFRSRTGAGRPPSEAGGKIGEAARPRSVASRTTVLDDVGLDVAPGEIVGVIGETGSGKTTLARAILGLVEPEAGAVHLDGVQISALRGRARREFRRSGRVGVVFQDPLRSLDPDLTIGRSVGEGPTITGTPRSQRDEAVAEALTLVGLDPALADRTPAGISGGQRQRASIARAIVGRPQLLICDEPVSALDASNRNHILRLLDSLRRELSVGIVVISHDLSSLAGIADRVVVLYRGRVVEDGPIADVFTRPGHPYTALLVASAPSVRPEEGLSAADLRPSPAFSWPHASGCVFAHRCRFATDACARTPRQEAAATAGPAWSVACHHAATWRDTLAADGAGPAGDAGPVAGRRPCRA